MLPLTVMIWPTRLELQAYWLQLDARRAYAAIREEKTAYLDDIHDVKSIERRWIDGPIERSFGIRPNKLLEDGKRTGGRIDSGDRTFDNIV